MIFRDRIVLKNGTVIMPDKIKRIERLSGCTEIETCIGVYSNLTYAVDEDEYHIDRPTGMVDSTGKEIFERDVVCSTDGDRGTVVMWRGKWVVRFDTPNLENRLLYEIDNLLTKGG